MKVKYGSIVTNSRGKLGGQYYSRNHYGPFCANITTPVNPQSIYQSTFRSNFLYFTQKWKTLTEEQQLAWIAAAPDFPKTDVFGDEYFSTGKNLYVSLNINKFLIGGTELDTPPTPETIIALPAIISLTAAADNSSYDIDYEENLTDTTSRVIVRATTGISPGIFAPSHQFRFLAYTAQTSQGNNDFKNEYETRFGTQTVGLKTFCIIQSIQITSGQLGVPIQASTLFV